MIRSDISTVPKDFFMDIFDIFDLFMAIPHNSKCDIAQQDFSSDDTKSGVNTLCIDEYFGRATMEK